MSDTNEDAVRQALDAASKAMPENDRHWPTPDRELVRSVRPPAPVLSEEDLHFIFGGFADWIAAASEAKSCAEAYVALTLLTVIGAIIGNTRWASPWDDWVEPPIVWVMLVGDPSSGKSPAMDSVLSEVSRIDARFSKEFREKRSAWEEKAEIAKAATTVWRQQVKLAIEDGIDPPAQPKEAKAPEAPIQRRVRIIDSTTEKIAEILQQTWRGLLQYRDELSGWLTSMDRYGGGGDREFWLEAFGGRAFTVDRKSNPEPLIVEHLSVCILGSTQPEKLDQLLLHSADDGLLSRFLIVFPDPVPLTRPTRKADRDFLGACLHRLLELEPDLKEDGSPTPMVVKFDHDAQEALQAFRAQCRAWETDVDGKMKSHVGKMPGLVVRVAMILAHLDFAAKDFARQIDAISENNVKRAIALIGSFTKAHAERALASSSVSKERQAANKIGAWILREQLHSISTREIMRKGWAGLGTAKEVDPAIEVLLAADWIAPVQQVGKGRPNKKYLVNPRLHEIGERT